MKSGTIFLFRVPPKPNLVQRAIEYFTGKPWVHAAINCDGFVYEATWPAIIRTPLDKWLEHNHPTEAWEPIVERPCERMRIYLETAVNLEWKYNWLKILALMLVYPTRWFWRKIGWVPFDSWIFGEICSVLVDEAWYAEGVDLLPGQRQGYTAPGDLRRRPGFVLMEVKSDAHA